MGTDIDQEEFDERDYARFAGRLEECLAVLAQLLNRPGFGTGPATIGAELELFLIDGAGRPLPRNQAIRAAAADPRITVELNRCNLELNASPALLAGQPFTALGGELNLLADRVAHAARDHRGRVAVIGILPTLSLADLGPVMMTDLPRYRDRSVIAPGSRSAGMRVGRMPMTATRPPWSLAAWATRSASRFSSPPSAVNGRPASNAGEALSSRLQRFSSSVTRGSATAARMAWLRGSGRPALSMRNSSSSAPMVAGPAPKPGWLSSCPSTVRHSSSRWAKRA